MCRTRCLPLDGAVQQWQWPLPPRAGVRELTPGVQHPYEPWERQRWEVLLPV